MNEILSQLESLQMKALQINKKFVLIFNYL